uniref:Portal protein n=1 Tax=viral metagenome TaxID=1070528 RepID=A0A6M3KGT2_9ZZZZ
MANKRFNEQAKKKKKEIKSDAGFSESVQDKIIVNLDDEFTVAKNNLTDIFNNGDDYYDMIHCVREKTQFDDEPNIYLPEYLSRLLAEQGNFCAQYFGSRDYVDIYMESDDLQDVAESKATKKLLNTILNDPDIHYYHKLNRLKMAISPKGYGVLKGSYKQVIEQRISGYDEREEYITDEEGNFLDIDGGIMFDPEFQEPAIENISEPIYEDVVVEDIPNFDIYPNRDVFWSPEYVYSLQDKRYVIFRAEKSLDDLREEAEQMGYFNLKILEEKYKAYITSSDKQYDGKTKEMPTFTVSPLFQIKERWGKYPCIDIERDEKGKVISAKPGYKNDGSRDDKAENIECIVTGASYGEGENSIKEIIRFQPSPHSKRPMVRFLCYVDENKDAGFGDGEGAIELQVAANDNFNLGLYRTLLATKPHFLGRKWRNIPEKIRVHSEDVTQLENMDDLQELIIKDDISGSIGQGQMLGNALDRLTAYSPLTMGDQPDRRETATVGAILDQRASIRQGLKNLNMEFIGFNEFYEMILTLCNDFMLPETLEKLIGEFAFAYNPERKDRFKPVTQAIETEHSKGQKVQMWQNIMQIAGNVPNPRTPMVLNYIIGQILEITGGDFKVFKKYMFEEDPQAIVQWNMIMGMGQNGGMPPPQPQGMQGGNAAMGGQASPPQNQQGLGQSGMEQQARQAMQ